MIQFAKLEIPVNLKAIQKELSAIENTWVPHFNQVQYEGEWSVLSLRSTNGNAEAIVPDLISDKEFSDTDLMKQCPAVKKLLQYFKCPLMAVRLMKLKAGSEIKEHRDHELAFEHGEARLHIPIFTNEDVAFFSEENRIWMREGECWYVNVNLPHRVSNKGDKDRIHLVIDCRVDEWLIEVFKNSQCTLASEKKQQDETRMIICELRKQKTEKASQLADELEQQISQV